MQPKIRQARRIIRKRLIDLEKTPSGMAQDLNYSKAYVSMILSGKRTSAKARKRICLYLGLDYERVFST